MLRFWLTIPVLFIPLTFCILIETSHAADDSEPSDQVSPNAAGLSSDLSSGPLLLLDHYLNASFRVRDVLNISLDGSEKAGGIQRQAETTSEVVHYSQDGIRVRRELPFSFALKEFLKTGDNVYSMTPLGKMNVNSFDYSDAIWAEVVLSPLRLATQWSIVDGKTSLYNWLKQLQRSPNASKKNVDGDEIAGKFSDKGIVITAHGKMLADTKTEVQISETWQLTDLAKVSENDLKKSLVKSN